MTDRRLHPPKKTQQELSSIIGIAYAQRAKLRAEGGTNLNPVRNPIAILEDGSLLVINATSTLTSESFEDRYFRCPNARCRHATGGEMAELKLARGSINQWHFKHRTDLAHVDHCRESMIHHWASEIVGGSGSLTVPKVNGCMGDATINPDMLRTIECSPVGTSHEATSIDRFRADAAVRDANGTIYIEVTYTHNTTRTKEAHYRSIDARVLEIVIDDTAPFEQDAFMDHVLHRAPRRWISHPAEFIRDQRIATEAEVRKERHARALNEAKAIVPEADGRANHEYVMRRDAVVAAHGLDALSADPEPSRWFSSNPQRLGQWRLDLVELAVLTPFRMHHGRHHNGIVDPRSQSLWSNLRPIITPELVVLGNDERNADLLDGRSPAQEVARTLKDVFEDVAGVVHRPRLDRIEFEPDALRSFGLAALVLEQAHKVAQCWGSAAPLVLNTWVRESGRMPIRQTDHPDGGRDYLNRMVQLSSALAVLLNSISIPRGKPWDLVGFDGIADIVDFGMPPNVDAGYRARPVETFGEPTGDVRTEPTTSEHVEIPEASAGPKGSMDQVEPPPAPEPMDPASKRDRLRRALAKTDHPASLEERVRLTDAYRDWGDAGGAVRYLDVYREGLGLQTWQMQGWSAEPIPELDGMSRRDYVRNGTDDSDPWSRLHVAIAIGR